MDLILICTLIIEYAFYATIWYAAICIIKEYHKKYPNERKTIIGFFFKKHKDET